MYVRLFGHPKSVTIMVTNTKTILMILLMCTASLAGCIGGDDKEEESVGACSGDKLVIAYEVKEDMDADSLENPQQIADYLCEELGMDVSIYNVGSSGLAMEALRFGNADIAMNIDGGPAWVGWNAYGLDVMAADTQLSLIHI